MQVKQTKTFLLSAGERIGQTFTASLDGLQGVSIYSGNRSGQEGQLHLRVYDRPGSPASVETFPGYPPLAETKIDLAAIAAPGAIDFSFPAIPDTSQRSLYLEFELQAPPGSALEIYAGPGESYLDGALYNNGQPEDAQLAFNLDYEGVLAGLGYLHGILAGLSFILLALLLTLLPGWALVDLLPGKLKTLDLASRSGLAAGIGFSLYPLLLLWSWVLGWQPGALVAWIPLIAASGYFVFRLRWAAIRLDLPGLLSIILVLLIAASRSAAVLGLPTPLWGDSYQHSLVTQLILDHGGLFHSWAPYTELNKFTYHFGFHTFAAALSFISGLPAPQAVLWSGQAASLLATLALLPLATKLARTPWAAPAVLLLVGLLSPMPAYYTNWGRYTQLSGQIVLPVFIWLSAATLGDILTHEKHMPAGWRVSLLVALTSAALGLTHVRILILAVLYPLTHALLSIAQPQRLRRYGWTIAAGATGALLYLPWLIHSFGSRLTSLFIQQISTPLSQVRQSISEVNPSGNLEQFLPAWLWLLLVVSLAWAAWRRRDTALPLLAWLAAAVIVANPQWLGLPGAAIVGAFTAYIAAYIPLGFFTGAWLGRLGEWLLEKSSRIWRPNRGLIITQTLLGLATLSAAAWGMLLRARDVRPDQFALVTYPDLRAAAWVKDNLPEQARLLVNAFPAFHGTSVVGADAGWWLPLLAHRPTTLPPLNYALEDEPYPGYREAVNQLVASIQQLGMDDSRIQSELFRRGVTHVFLGQRQGSLNNPYPPLLDPKSLTASPIYRLVYHQDRVYIFEVLK